MAKRTKQGKTAPMTREQKHKRDERNQRRGRDSKQEAFRKNKVIPNESS